MGEKSPNSVNLTIYFSIHIQLLLFFFRKYARTCQKTLPFRPLERKHASPSVHHIDDQLGMLPIFKLIFLHIERRIAYFAEQHIGIADPEFISRIAHRRPPVATAAGLMEHE